MNSPITRGAKFQSKRHWKRHLPDKLSLEESGKPIQVRKTVVISALDVIDDHHGGNAGCTAKLETMVAETGHSKRQLQRAIEVLRRLGIVQVVRRRGTTTVHRINWNCLAKLAEPMPPDGTTYPTASKEPMPPDGTTYPAASKEPMPPDGTTYPAASKEPMSPDGTTYPAASKEPMPSGGMGGMPPQHGPVPPGQKVTPSDGVLNIETYKPPPKPSEEEEEEEIISILVDSGLSRQESARLATENPVTVETAKQAVAEFQANRDVLKSPGAISHYFRNGDWPSPDVRTISPGKARQRPRINTATDRENEIHDFIFRKKQSAKREGLLGNELRQRVNVQIREMFGDEAERHLL